MHTSIKLDTPIEFINVTPLNPLISKCQIKVCYVGDEPNRNGSIITKEVAKQMANSLPGSPIVGFYNEDKDDFEGHNRIIDVSDGKFEIKDNTKPYGFVDLGAKVWFQKFLDDNEFEHEYLMTEGYIWTGQYPEAQRIIDKGNNQSMELDENTIDAFWTKDGKGLPQFFIINEAIISKLCILGEDREPCFEGSNIVAPQIVFSFEDGFKEQLFSMMNEIKKVLNEGGASTVFTTYAVEIGDNLWNSLYSYLQITYPHADNEGYVYDSMYRIEGIYEEGSQKFAILQNRSNNKFFRMNFSLDEVTGFSASNELIEVTKTYTPAAQPQFDAKAVEAYALEYLKKKQESEEETENSEEDEDRSEDTSENENEEKEEKTEFSEEEQDKKEKYNLDEIQEYVELSNKYSALETNYSNAQSTIDALQAQVKELTEFKAKIEKAEKEKMIESFYMLSDQDKKDVIDNIDKYSLDDIEAKLSIICVRNKVSFNLDNDKDNSDNPTVFNLNGGLSDDAPAWIKAIRSVASNM